MVPETLEAALQLAGVALAQVGLSELAVSVAIKAQREGRLGRNERAPPGA